jgi:hypothetical protein
MKERVPMKFAATVAPPVIMILGALLLFREPLLTGTGLYGSDFALQFHPWKKFVLDHLQSQGSLPFWNPYVFSGSPLISNIQVSLFYPLGFLYYLMSPNTAYGYSTLIHFVLGLGFMYLFMRSLDVHRAACLFSATVFMFNGYFMGHLYAGHLSFVQNYIWIPLIFFFLNRFVNKGSLGNAVAAGVALSFQILGGFPQIAFYTILASSLFILVRGVLARKSEKSSLFQAASGWGVFVLLGFTLAAIQILPTYEFTTLSTRGGGVSYEMATYESLHPKEILAFLLPDLFGNPVDGTYWRSREFWHFWESCGYVGILPLFFLFVGGRGAAQGGVRAFAVLLILLALFLALGRYNPLYPLIYHLPGFGSFRIPAQIIFLYVFGVAVLSGIGSSRIIEAKGEFTTGFWIFCTLAGLVLVCAIMGLTFLRQEFFLSLFRNFSEGPVTHADLSLLSGRISQTIYRSCLIFFLSLSLLMFVKHGRMRTFPFSVLACVIVFVDLYLFVSPLVKVQEFVMPAEKQSLLSQLSRSPVEGRVVTSDRAFKANDGLMYRFPSIQGYDPLILKKYADYFLTSQGYPYDDRVIVVQDVPAPEAKLVALLNLRQLVSGGEVKALKNEIPYAFLVPKATVKPEENILQFMQSDAFDPLKTVVFSKQPKHGLISTERDLPFDGSCQVLRYGNEEIRLRVSCNQPAYLVMSEIWYPGWVALIDGKEREVLCGNSIFRVVPVEEGNHEVTLFFVSWPFRVGGLISLVTVLGCACLLFLGRRSAVDTQG